MTLCCAASAESLDGGSSTETLRQSLSPVLKTVCGQSSADVQTVELDSDSLPNAPNETSVKALTVAFKTPNLPSKQSFVADEQSFTLGQIEFAALTPLHIDSVVFDSSLHYSPDGGSVVDSLETEREQINCSRLIDALDIQSPARFKHHVSSGPQSTPYKPGVETKDDRFPPTRPGFVVSLLHERSGISKPVQNQQAVSPQKARVADHIQHFNKLTLYSPPGSKTKQIRSPLKFQRTPVRQTVCRINSLLGDSRRPRNNAVFGVGQSPRVAKTVSLESGLSPHPQPQQRRPQTRLLNSRTTAKNPPAVPPKKQATLDRIPKSCALGDVTNKAQQKTKVESSASTPSEAQKLLLQQVAEKDTPHYRGSPRNPLNQGNLLSAMKPIDL